MKHFLILLAFIVPYSVFAENSASVSLFPAVGTYPIGDVFTVSVNVDTGGQSINAVEGKISFKKDELEVAALSKDGSILESWTTDPAYSNEEGTISFSGALKNFAGDSGKIISIDFRALKNTEAFVRFSTGAAILAADGQGTNILTLMNAGAYQLVPKEIFSSVEPIPQVLGASTSTEEKIIIASASHPDENTWYGEKTAKFSWTLPSDAIAVRLSLNAASSGAPTKLYSPPISEKTVKDADEGVSYFHFQMKTESGWGEPATYRFQTDTEKPEAFQITIASTTDAFGFLFDARDKTSGIEKYLVQMDGGAETEWRDDGSRKYVPGEQKPGAHILSAKAVDFAGNFATSSVNFTLEPVHPPTIADFQEKILPGNPLVIRGQADPNAPISVWVSKDGTRAAENKVVSGEDGIFTFVLSGKTEEGIYKIYAEEIGRGTRSAPSANALVSVSQPKIILFGNAALGYLSILIPLATLGLLLLFILVYGFHRFRIFRATLQKEVEEIETASRKSFADIRKAVSEDERILADIGRGASKEKVKEVAAHLKKSIDDAEVNVEKEISDVKAKVKKSVKVKIKNVS
jgi:hypothetical protein